MRTDAGYFEPLSLAEAPRGVLSIVPNLGPILLRQGWSVVESPDRARLFLRRRPYWEAPAGCLFAFFWLSHPAIRKRVQMVRDTGFEPVTPTVSR